MTRLHLVVRPRSRATIRQIFLSDRDSGEPYAASISG